METVLITGASGLIGTELSQHLISDNYEVAHLSRSKSTNGIQTFIWDLDKNYIEEGALDNVDHIVHLAGAGIADKRWSADRKKEIIDSRVNSTKLLFNEIRKLKIKPKSFLSASAIGYYGANTSNKIYSETNSKGNDFQAEVCNKWEHESIKFKELGIRTIQMRFGVILSPNGGALKKMLLPTKLGIGSALGSGDQYLPWIHISDTVRAIKYLLDNSNYYGAYNIVSSSHDTYNNFAETLAKVLKKPFFMPNVPGFVLKLVFGEMAEIILEGSRISNKKLLETGFKFNHSDLTSALTDLLK